jgi:hypothetical protein
MTDPDSVISDREKTPASGTPSLVCNRFATPYADHCPVYSSEGNQLKEDMNDDYAA